MRTLVGVAKRALLGVVAANQLHWRLLEQKIHDVLPDRNVGRDLPRVIKNHRGYSPSMGRAFSVITRACRRVGVGYRVQQGQLVGGAHLTISLCGPGGSMPVTASASALWFHCSCDVQTHAHACTPVHTSRQSRPASNHCSMTTWPTAS